MAGIEIIILAMIAGLLWKIAFKKQLLAIPANSNEWIMLVTYKINNTGDIEKATWDPEAPVTIEFVPIIGWEYMKTDMTPITPPVYRIPDRLNVAMLDKNAKYETVGYCIRDGAVFDIADMTHSDFWADIYDYASAGYTITIQGAVPVCYHEKFSEIIQISEQERAKKLNQQQEGT